MRLLAAGIMLALAAGVRAEIVDQIAATVDDHVITTSEVATEIRVTAFLNGEAPDFSPANRRRTADRLIEQSLVHHEMDLTRYLQPERSEIEGTLKQLRERAGGSAAFDKELAARMITEPELEDALLRQAALLRFIDLRFRPEVQMQDDELQHYCETVFLPQLKKKGAAPETTVEDVRPQCTEAYAGQLVDNRVDTWLKEARSRARITYEEDAFQ